MKLSPQDKVATTLDNFRNAYGASLTSSQAKEIWGEGLSDEYLVLLSDNDAVSEVTRSKIAIGSNLVRNLSKICVKYIGISGSVGSNVAREGDDIDLFIVVRDHFSWIYRIYTKIKLGSNAVWYGQAEQKDKLCINFICEERGLSFEEHDLFTFNEIFSLKGVYNEPYFNKIVMENLWLFDEYMVDGTLFDNHMDEGNNKLVDMFLFCLNGTAFLTQLAYMWIMGHDPNFSRLFDGFKKGRIQFYPESFREEKLKKFNSSS